MSSAVLPWMKRHIGRRASGVRRPDRRIRCELFALEDRLVPAITLLFDYSLDTAGFFASRPAAKTALERAAAAVSGTITDTLTAIPASPGSGPNTWDAIYFDPNTGDSVRKPGPAIPANTLLVYVGARRLQVGGSSELAEAAGGGYSSSFESQAYFDNIVGRGHPQALGNNPTKYAPWGGTIAFDSDTNWDFTVNAVPPAGKQSFFQTAEHEIGHLLGVGASIPQWKRHIVGGAFTGPQARAVFGGQNIPLDPTGSHWASNVQFAGIVPTMIPFSNTDPPNIFTPLDYAALRDVGWSLPSSHLGGAQFTAQATTASVAEGGDVVLKIDGAFNDGVHLLRVRTVDGAAKQGTNYQAVDRTLVFLPWQKSRNVTIKTTKDFKATVDLGFTVELLYAQSNVTGSPSNVGFSVINTDAGNRAPVFDPIPAQSGSAGTLFTYQVRAVDPDAGQTVVYSLGAGAPAGAAIHPTTGLVSFTPTQASADFQIPVVATDNGSPPASDTAVLSLSTRAVDPTDVLVGLGASNFNPRYGQTVEFTATVSPAGGDGTPGGTVTLLDGAAPIGLATLDGQGRAVFSIAGLSPGGHSLVARYEGNATHRTSQSAPVVVVVSRHDTTLSLTSSAPTAFVGQAVVFTARVAPTTPSAFAPSGLVTFFDRGKILRTVPLFNGAATLSLTSNDPKLKRSLTATYSGDGGFGASRTLGALVQSTTVAPTVVTASAVRVGDGAKASIRFVVTVGAAPPAGGTPTGSVSISVGGRRIATAKLRNGSAAIKVPLAKVAGRTVAVAYLGDGKYRAGQTSAAVVV